MEVPALCHTFNTPYDSKRLIALDCLFIVSTGETNLDSLMTTLITAVEEHNVQLERELQEEVCTVHRLIPPAHFKSWFSVTYVPPPPQGFSFPLCIVLYSISVLQQDRIAREFMIAEQNRAFQESLDADREKVCWQ